MNLELFHTVNGYISALASVSSYYGLCYGHRYKFTHYKVTLEEAIRLFKKDSFNKLKDNEIVGLTKIEKWEDELFHICNNWFFQFLDKDQPRVTFEENGHSSPAYMNKDFNPVTSEIIELLQEFFKDHNLSVYRLKIHPEYIDEFTWDQYFFETSDGIFVLSFYQWG
ncbi:hypothetical protein ABH14_20215 [Brevibacillus brevis]|uniref:hypothetical protein n=1 Tax=Brevibacillus brevis TaxID=1393 RepID=UPI0019003B54|nr:hypothetical protein [Brevibacillus brevis]MBH0332049.1 hypothetical protein [Brevibacillus brevis]